MMEKNYFNGGCIDCKFAERDKRGRFVLPCSGYSNCSWEKFEGEVDPLTEEEKDQRIAELEEENKEFKELLNADNKIKTNSLAGFMKLLEENAKLKELLDNPHDVWVENNRLTEINNWQNGEIKRLHEQLKNMPKFHCGETFYWLTDGGVCKDKVLQVIFYRDRLAYINAVGVHFECDYGKESEQGLFATEAEAQKHLEEHK